MENYSNLINARLHVIANTRRSYNALLVRDVHVKVKHHLADFPRSAITTPVFKTRQQKGVTETFPL